MTYQIFPLPLTFCKNEANLREWAQQAPGEYGIIMLES